MDTPCIKFCVLDEATGLCAGCYRSRDEIAGWIGLGGDARRQIMAELPARRLDQEYQRARAELAGVRR